MIQFLAAYQLAKSTYIKEPYPRMKVSMFCFCLYWYSDTLEGGHALSNVTVTDCLNVDYITLIYILSI